MIGNDIVSLDLVRQSPKVDQPAYLTKVLTVWEREQLNHSPDQELTLWKFWALKESAYKLEFKQFRHRYFAPKKFECRIDDVNANWSEAMVRSSRGICFGKVWNNDQVIHALVASTKAELDTIKFATTFLPSDQPAVQSRTVRHCLQKMLSSKLGVSEQEVKVRKEEGIPFVAIQDETLAFDISLSHHGQWGAVSYTRIKNQ